jgi:phosphopantothenoylcysteine decarboxylase/phosphopantothenate--cysteine ligase
MIIMRILVTAGPTREFVDDVRFLSNASSGRMGYSIADAAIKRGHEVVLVTGPVDLPCPAAAEVHAIETTDELRARCLELFPQCDGVIATAAVCDYRPKERVTGKMTKTGRPIVLELVETSDVLAELGSQKEHRWVVGFALESQDPRTNAMRKLRMKNCDCIVLNDTSAISSLGNHVEILSPEAETIAEFHGPKTEIAAQLIVFVESSIAKGPYSNPNVRPGH